MMGGRRAGRRVGSVFGSAQKGQRATPSRRHSPQLTPPCARASPAPTSAPHRARHTQPPASAACRHRHHRDGPSSPAHVRRGAARRPDPRAGCGARPAAAVGERRRRAAHRVGRPVDRAAPAGRGDEMEGGWCFGERVGSGHPSRAGRRSREPVAHSAPFLLLPRPTPCAPPAACRPAPDAPPSPSRVPRPGGRPPRRASWCRRSRRPRRTLRPCTRWSPPPS